MYVVATGTEGHYLNYSKIINDCSDVGVVNIIFEGRGLFYNFFYILTSILRTSGVQKKIIFLNGEQAFLPILIKIFLPTYRVSSVVYYSFFGFGFNSFVKKHLFCFSSMIGIFIYFLEGEEWVSSSRCFFSSRYRSLRDPALLYFGDLNPGKREANIVTYLLVGYIDERKCVPEILGALECLFACTGLNQKLIILGKQSSVVEHYLTSYTSPDGVEVLIINKRFSDEEYAQYLVGTDIVLAVYRDHLGSSGVVINAILYGKKIIFIPVGATAAFASRLGIKDLPQSHSVDAIKEALMAVMNSSQYDASARLRFLEGRGKYEFYLALTS